jgi:hypothetical protein
MGIKSSKARKRILGISHFLTCIFGMGIKHILARYSLYGIHVITGWAESSLVMGNISQTACTFSMVIQIYKLARKKLPGNMELTATGR